MKSPTTRRLVAILVADVVGYSRHMEQDDAGTLARLREIRESVVDPGIAAHGGRIVNVAGDGMLVEFGSADASLRYAVEVQRTMAERNRMQSAGARIEFRIGINLADIIADGNDIAGDGVNVAARLEALAAPGGICVSSAVRDQVHGSIDVAFVDIGERQVKNIGRPIRAFAVALDAADTSGTAVEASGTAPRQASLSPLSPEPPAMSIGVMPLVALSGDAAAAQQAESMTRDLTAMLARTATIMRVIPVPLAQAKAARDDVLAAARALNVRYLGEGEVRQSREATLVGLRVVDGATGEQFWSESVSLDESAGPAERWRVLHAIVWHLSRALISAELRRVAAQPAPDDSAMGYVMRALALERTEGDALKMATGMGELLEEALQRDPNFVPALVLLTRVLTQQIDYDVRVDRDRLVGQMNDLTSKAMRLNDSQPAIWVFRSIVLMFMGQWNASLQASARGLALEPYSSGLTLHHAALMTLSGRPAESIVLANKALVLDLRVDTLSTVGEAQLMLGEYRPAIESLEKARGVGLDELMIYLFLAAAYGQVGDSGNAAAARADLLRLVPGYTIASHKSKGYSMNPDYLRLAETHLYAGMRKAGFAEQ